MIQMCASHFTLKKEFEFKSDLNNNMDEYNKASHEADEVPPQQWISDDEDANGFDEEEVQSETEQEESLPEPHVILKGRGPPPTNTHPCCTQQSQPPTGDQDQPPTETCPCCTATTAYMPGHFHSLNNGKQTAAVFIVYQFICVYCIYCFQE